MNLNDLLHKQQINPEGVLVLRHRPKEPEFNKVLPWLAAERHELFNAYQMFQGEKLEKAMVKAGYVLSFIRHRAGRALFIGLYAVKGFRPTTYQEFIRLPEIVELTRLGMTLPDEQRFQPHRLWFDLELAPFYPEWKGRLVVRWPPPERSWWRRAHKNDMPIESINDQDCLVSRMPKWDTLDVPWVELQTLPSSWKAALREWRGVYYIFDTSDGKGYVGSAYGDENIAARWEGYATTGHGGNQLLKQRDPKNFRFTILQRVSPDLPPDEVIRIESTWKERLHTRPPFGLNDN